MEARSYKKNLFHLTWPIFCESVLYSIVGSMDVMMLSGYSDHAVGAVGVANQILFLFQVISNIITAGTGILCAQYIGAGRGVRDKMSLIIAALCMNGILGMVCSLMVVAGADVILHGMNLSDELYVYGKQYLSIVGGFLFVQMIAMTFSTLIRAHGKTKAAMYFSIVMNGTNFVLNYIWIYGKFGAPAMGAAGAAAATVVSKLVCCILAGGYLYFAVLSDGDSYSVDWKKVKESVRSILAYGSPAAGEQISYTLSKLVVMMMVTSLGTIAVNTYSYVNTVVGYVYLFAMAIGQGTSILIGWAVGKSQLEEAKDVCRFSLRCSFLISLVTVGCLCAMRQEILGLFTEDPAILAMGSSVILSDILLEIGRSRNLVLVNALRAAGDVRFPLRIGLFSMWFFSVGMSWVLGIALDWKLVGIWIALGLDECFRAVGMQIRWKRGRWMQYAAEETKIAACAYPTE